MFCRSPSAIRFFKKEITDSFVLRTQNDTQFSYCKYIWCAAISPHPLVIAKPCNGFAIRSLLMEKQILSCFALRMIMGGRNRRKKLNIRLIYRPKSALKGCFFMPFLFVNSHKKQGNGAGTHVGAGYRLVAYGNTFALKAAFFKKG